MKKILLVTLSASALMAAQPLMAKTLVYCSEGSPENFAPSVNTTGTSFDANTQIYDTIVQFERGDRVVLSDVIHDLGAVLARLRSPRQANHLTPAR